MNIWILNHYATNQYSEHGGRHYSLAKYLIRAGHYVHIFCAGTVHNTDKNLIKDRRQYREDTCDGIPFVFVKTRDYKGNGKSRILNMLDFYHNVQKAASHFEKPDVIIGSSVHPLACVAAIRMAKKLRCKSIAEIRDLWPESIVAYGLKNKQSLIIRLLYKLEKWIYTKADHVIFTMEGGRDYIIEKGWDKEHGGSVDMDKVHHINNGVNLANFRELVSAQDYQDTDLSSEKTFKVVYTGSMRLANRVSSLVDVAENLAKRRRNDIMLLLWGKGDQVDNIQALIKEKGLSNIVYKGSVQKQIVPQILAKSDLNIYILENTPLVKYGVSMNKLFEYLASGKPVLASCNSGYSLIDRYQCGVCLDTFTPERMADEIIRFADMNSDEYCRYCSNASLAAEAYDFSKLTDTLISIIES